MAQKNQDHVAQSGFTPRNSPPQSRTTPSTTGSSSQSCEASDTGPICSKEPKPLSWYTLTTPTSVTTAIQGKSDRALLDTSQNANSTTSYWSTNQELQTAQTLYPAAQTMRATTQKTTMSSYGLTNIFVNSTQPSESMTLTAHLTTSTQRSFKRKRNTNQS